MMHNELDVCSIDFGFNVKLNTLHCLETSSLCEEVYNLEGIKCRILYFSNQN